MNIGIIAEGKSDLAVIQRILNCYHVDSSQIIPLRPELQKDEYDNNKKPETKNEREFGSWTNVMNDCKDREIFDNFFALENNKTIIIQLDTAETDKYNVNRPAVPKKNETYYTDVRKNVIQKIGEWSDNSHTDELLYAIAIEEVDAWVLAIYENKDTCNHANPKETLRHVLKNKFEIEKPTKQSVFDFYLQITEPFGWKKSKNGKNNLKDARKYNISLSEFVSDVESFIKKMNQSK